ncbi:MAG: hypothetical protein DWQ19_09915 [Crenarchaeota archaeon]|nr:MAG: hypothetical protein DWQ19_09915 [Thermoproteota archaeon]
MDKISYAVTAFWLLVSFGCYVAFRNLEVSNHEYFHTCKTIEISQDYYRLVTQTENYHRNFLITEDPAYRKLYEEFKGKLLPELKKVKEVAITTEQKKLLKDAETIVLYRCGIWDGTLIIYDNEGSEAVKEHVVDTYKKCGIEKMHQLRNIFDKIIAEEKQMLTAREKSNNYRFQNLETSIYIAVAFSIIIFLLPLVIQTFVWWKGWNGSN